MHEPLEALEAVNRRLEEDLRCERAENVYLRELLEKQGVVIPEGQGSLSLERLRRLEGAIDMAEGYMQGQVDRIVAMDAIDKARR